MRAVLCCAFNEIMKCVKIFQNGICVPINLECTHSSSGKNSHILQDIENVPSDGEKEWRVLTHADRLTCFPHVKLTVDSKNVDGLFLFVCPTVERTEPNIFRKYLPFPLNIRLIYGNVVIAFSHGTQVISISLLQWQHIIEQWIGATSDLAIIQKHLKENKSDGKCIQLGARAGAGGRKIFDSLVHSSIPTEDDTDDDFADDECTSDGRSVVPNVNFLEEMIDIESIIHCTSDDDRSNSQIFSGDEKHSENEKEDDEMIINEDCDQEDDLF